MNDLVDSLANFIEDAIRERNLRWIVSIPASSMTVLSILGFAFDRTQAAVVLLFLALGTTLISLIVLALSRRAMRKELKDTSGVLNSYGEKVRREQESDPEYFSISGWKERLTVSNHGNTTIVKDLAIIVGGRPIGSAWTMIYRNSDAYMSSGIKSRIRLRASVLNDDGSLGTQIVTTRSFEGSCGLRIFFHFREELKPTESATIRIVVQWPRYFADPLDERTEENYWIMRHPSESLDSTVTLEKKYSRRGVIVSSINGSARPTVTKHPDSGSTEIHLTVKNPPLNQKCGYTLELDK